MRKDGKAYVHHLDSFIVALREELDSPGGVNARNPPAIERKPYRMDVKHDGTGIESQGWFRASNDTKEANVDSMMMSRLCALHWIIVLYESVVPDVLKADVSEENIENDSCCELRNCVILTVFVDANKLYSTHENSSFRLSIN